MKSALSNVLREPPERGGACGLVSPELGVREVVFVVGVPMMEVVAAEDVFVGVSLLLRLDVRLDGVDVDVGSVLVGVGIEAGDA